MKRYDVEPAEKRFRPVKFSLLIESFSDLRALIGISECASNNVTDISKDTGVAEIDIRTVIAELERTLDDARQVSGVERL